MSDLKRETENAVFAYALTRKSEKLSGVDWMKMGACVNIRRAFRAGAMWERKRQAKISIGEQR